MFRKLLILSTIFILSACSTTATKQIFMKKGKVSEEVVKEAVETRPEVVQKPVLNISKPEKPKIKNDMVIYSRNIHGVDMICTTRNNYKSHLTDLLEILDYQKSLDDVLDSYLDYYEDKK